MLVSVSETSSPSPHLGREEISPQKSKRASSQCNQMATATTTTTTTTTTPAMINVGPFSTLSRASRLRWARLQRKTSADAWCQLRYVLLCVCVCMCVCGFAQTAIAICSHLCVRWCFQDEMEFSPLDRSKSLRDPLVHTCVFLGVAQAMREFPPRSIRAPLVRTCVFVGVCTDKTEFPPRSIEALVFIGVCTDNDGVSPLDRLKQLRLQTMTEFPPSID